MQRLNKNRFKKLGRQLLKSLLAVSMFFPVMTMNNVYAAVTEEHSMMPSVKEYTLSSGEFSVTEESRIFYASEEKPDGHCLWS